MQKLKKDILTLDKEQEKLLKLVQFIGNKLVAIIRAFPDSENEVELLIEGYQVNIQGAIVVYDGDGSYVQILEYMDAFQMYCSGKYENDFSMIQYEKNIYFDQSGISKNSIAAFKFVAEHDPRIFIPLFVVAKHMDKAVQACINKIDIDIQKEMHYVNEKKHDRDVMERLLEHIKSDEYLQEIDG